MIRLRQGYGGWGRLAIVLVLCITTAAPCVWAHGVQHVVSEGATVVSATYDDGSPMAFCDVIVLAPKGGEEPYQEGTSDRNGCFAFLPDTNGNWRVTVDDGMGHLVEANIAIDANTKRATGSARTTDRLRGAVTGVSVIFGIFGVYAMIATRARRHEARRERGT